MNNIIEIAILLDNGNSIELSIYANTPGTLQQIDKQDAIENGESPYQLMEGKRYEYAITKGYRLEESEAIKQSKIESNKGVINTNIYVGSLKVNILNNENNIVGTIILEVRSAKIRYKEDYKSMLEYITSKSIDLILQHASPVYQTFTVDPENTPNTLYQRFAFVDSIIRSDSFVDALHRINSMPVKRWKSTESSKSINNIRRPTRSVIRQIATNKSRTALNQSHPLNTKFTSLPNKVTIPDKSETTDIPENRFVKYVLETFVQFTLSIYNHPKATPFLKRDALSCFELLNKHLSMQIFKDISQLDIIPLNSPVLQRKEGYREILQTYLMFDMAASLVWKGGEEVYEGGKRNVAVLYEYWLFFKLLELMEEVFNIQPRSLSDIIKPTKDGLELTLEQSTPKVLSGVFATNNRNFNVEFCYNRTFTRTYNYSHGGSWTKSMRPDYTLSIWPETMTQEQAEAEETIVHIHFDAKYKIDNYEDVFADVDLDQEKKEQAKGNYKRADLLKMHAYKDAIRRSAGAYILYPGQEKETFQNFHEILPGLGAFSVSPANNDVSGLRQFLQDVVQHFANRASQRELHAYHTFATFKEPPGPMLNDPLPLKNRDELPRTTYVLVGYYKNAKHLEWILKNKLYNTRTDNYRGSLKLNSQTIGAKYLLLHTKGKTKTNLIFKLDDEGPRIISAEQLQKLNYPSTNIKPYYIGYSLQSNNSIIEEFGNIKWDVNKLSNYQSEINSGKPFTLSLEDLMKLKVEQNN